ncbi:MAG: DUF655 domain-containing protein [Thermofilaceae archaeon]
MFDREFRDFRRRPPEATAYVLDVLPFGDPIRRINHPLIQCIGGERFTLMELRPVGSAAPSFKPGEKIDLRGGLESQILVFERVIRFSDLSSTAKNNLREVLYTIVKENEKRFADFFNNAQPLSKRAHELELLKGIGKKTLWKILEERKRKPFENFEDIAKRVGIDPVKLVMERILEELQEPQAWYLFVRPPRFGAQRQEGRRPFP